MIRLRRITAIDAVTATTVSSKYWVGGARRIGIQVRRAANAGGTSAFTVKGSLQALDDGTGTPDSFGNRTGGAGVTMTALNTLIDNVTNAIGEGFVRVNGVSIANANGDKFMWVSPECLVNWLEITATETTDGTHSAWIVVEEETPSNGTF
jgi:hypothetical protein